MEFRINFWYMLKSNILENPFSILIFCFAVFLPLIATMIRLAELPYIDVSDRERENKLKVDQFDSKINAYYLALNCLCTLGLGDFYASTLIGRTIATFAFIIGNSLFGLLVFGISKKLEFDLEETRADQMIEKQVHTTELHDRAGDALRTALRLNKLRKKRDAQSMGQRFLSYKQLKANIRDMRASKKIVES